MSERIGRVETEVFVDHGSFELLDDGGPQDFGTPGFWLSTGTNAVVVRTAQSDRAAVAVEAWTGEPPAARGWPASTTSTVRLDSGDVEINPLVEGEDTRWITVGGPGEYRVRVYAGPDRYLFQFWCVSRSGSNSGCGRGQRAA
jgi:hypothetical protein